MLKISSASLVSWEQLTNNVFSIIPKNNDVALLRVACYPSARAAGRAAGSRRGAGPMSCHRLAAMISQLLPKCHWLCCHLCASYYQEKPSHLPSYTYCKVFTWWSVLWIEVIFVPIFVCTVNFIMLYFVLRFYIFSCICIVWSKLYDFSWRWCMLLYCIIFIIFIGIV